MTFNLPSLRDRAMTVTFKQCQYRPTRVDKAKTRDVQMAEGTKGYKVLKTILSDCRELRAAKAAYYQLSKYIMANTLPWCDEGVRLLPNASYLDFAQRVGELRREADAAVDELYQHWDFIVAKDMARYGAAANPDDYPSAIEMLSKWRIAIRFTPIPEATDFRVDVSDEDRREMEQEFEDAARQSSDYLLKQLLEPVSKMVEALSRKVSPSSHGYEATLVTNITDMVARARKLNINNDSRVAQICDEADSILKGLSTPMLKADAELASDVREGMARVQKKLSDWF